MGPCGALGSSRWKRPGEIALVVAKDGAPLPAERILGREVECDNFQDAEAFLANGGERGRQSGFLTAGHYRINPALFDVVTTATAAKHGMDPSQLRVFQVPADRVGIVVGLAKAEAEAQTVLKVGAARAEAEAGLVLKVGAAKAEAHRQGQEALGAAGYTAVQIASILGEHHVKLVPDISVGSGSTQSGGLAEVLIGRMLASGVQGLTPPVPPHS